MYFVASSIRLAGAAALGLALTACGGGSQAAPATAADAPTVTVASADEWSTLVQSGQSSFDTACGACHPGGEADLGPTLIDGGWSTQNMYTQIRAGSGRMKPISEARLPESEMKGLLVYLAEIGAVSDIAHP